MKIRDRIKELRRVMASELSPNPKNWRTHTHEQIEDLILHHLTISEWSNDNAEFLVPLPE